VQLLVWNIYEGRGLPEQSSGKTLPVQKRCEKDKIRKDKTDDDYISNWSPIEPYN